MFQKQILKLKTLKGVGSIEKLPSKKGNGFLSIEVVNNAYFLVYRNYLGATQFSGLIQAKITKVKAMEKGKAKIIVAVRDAVSKKYEVEHCEVKFTGEGDRDGFVKCVN